MKINFTQMRFYIEIRNNIGNFIGAELNGTEDQFNNLKEIMSNIPSDQGYEMDLADGSYIVIGPKVVQESIFILHTIE